MLGVQYGMLRLLGFGAAAATSAIANRSVFTSFATLVMPVLWVRGLLATAWSRGPICCCVFGIVVIGVAVVAFAVVLRSERGARTIGRWADRLIDPLIRRLRHGQSADLTGKLLDFRSSVVDVMRTRWLQVTVSTLLLQLTSWAVLVLALRGLEVGTGEATVTWNEALAAFSFARVASFIPVTPGGLGTVDAALAALLTATGRPAARPWPPTWCGGRDLRPQVVLGALPSCGGGSRPPAVSVCADPTIEAARQHRVPAVRSPQLDLDQTSSSRSNPSKNRSTCPRVRVTREAVVS